MQSTGHTSTQERSFKPMQGSAMMYGMRVLGCLFTPLAGPNRKHRLGPPPVKCASRSRFAPAANAGTQRLVGTARCLRSDNRTPRMPRRPNAILMRDSVSVVGMLVLIVACRSEEHTSELQSRLHLVCRLLLEKKKTHRSYLQNRQLHVY